ncbi:MAG: murein biosynthesis integral membrane protein MurJ [Chlamydiales bacterium]
MHDSQESIIRSVKRFFSGTFISRLTGLGREVTMAAAFGTLPAVAAFWMAFRFAYLFRRIFGEGALNIVFIPHFEMLRKTDPKKGALFFYDLCSVLIGLLLAITLVTIAVLGSVLYFGSPGAANQEVIRLTILLLPALLFISLYALNTSILNCEGSYFLPSVAPACVNVIWMSALFFLWKFPAERAMEYLAMIIVLAFAMQWLITLPRVYRFLSKELGDGWWKGRRSTIKEVGKILGPFLIGLLGVTATQINSALDALFARTADPQGPAFLWYAIRIQQLPLALFGIGLTGALLPPIARAIQNKDEKKYVRFLNFALNRSFSLMLPFSAALFALGFAGINLIYGHGAFSSNAIFETTLCLWAYATGLFPMTVVLIFASAFYAQKNYRTPTLLASVSVGFNVGLNAWFVFGLKMGAVSVAVATAAASMLNAFALGYFLKKKQRFSLRLSSAKTGICSLTATIFTIIFGYWVFQDNTLLWVIGRPLTAFPREITAQLIVFGSEVFCFGGIFLATAYLLRFSLPFEWVRFGGLETRK